MGIKERRTKILAALFFLKDLDFGQVTFTKEIQSIFDISLNPKTKSTLNALVKDGLIEKHEGVNTDGQNEEGKKTIAYSLTPRGYQQLCLEFPFCRFMREEWDGKWRILSYEIPEKKREMRDRLRREVSGWGLGPWHRSFWITPHPIIPNLKTLVSNKEEETYVQAFESEHVFGNREVLIEKVWQTSLLEKKYRALFKTWHDILASQVSKEDKLRKVITEYIVVMRMDPGLPSKLVGENWIGFESFKIYKEIRNILTA